MGGLTRRIPMTGQMRNASFWKRTPIAPPFAWSIAFARVTDPITGRLTPHLLGSVRTAASLAISDPFSTLRIGVRPNRHRHAARHVIAPCSPRSKAAFASLKFGRVPLLSKVTIGSSKPIRLSISRQAFLNPSLAHGCAVRHRASRNIGMRFTNVSR